MQRINSMKYTYLVLLISFLAGNLQATVFTINTTDDSGTGSLRDAINNLAAGSNTIQFDIPTTDPGYDAANGTWTITPATDLPMIVNPVTITGYSFGGAVYNTATPNDLEIGNNAVLQIILNGNNYTTGDGIVTGNGLHFAGGSDGSFVNGLVINEWLGSGILVDAADANITGITITGNFIGTDAMGTTVLANRTGIGLSSAINTVFNTIIGTPLVADRNIIAGSITIVFTDSYDVRGGGIFSFFSQGTTIVNNYIGTDASGTVALGNSLAGINLRGDSPIIGGPSAEFRNLISGQLIYGIRLRACSGTVQNNYIGTDITGTLALGNLNSGIEIDDDFTSAGFTTGNTIINNLVSGNFNGIHLGDAELTGAILNTVQNNLVGTDYSGTRALPNTGYGLVINSAQNTITGNTISGNGIDGILVYSQFATANSITDNAIGTNKLRILSLGNQGNGMRIGLYTVGASTSANIVGA